MYGLSNNQTAGIWSNVQPRQHECPPEWSANPPTAMLSDTMAGAFSEYLTAVQQQSKISHERAALFTDDADHTALKADTELAGTLAPGAEVGTPSLDRLAQDRRRVIVAQGGAAIACDNALARAAEVRHSKKALNPASSKAAAVAQSDALALLDQLEPLLQVIATHAAAVRWASGERYLPSRDAAQLAAAIREDVTA